jgi:hypothetical protein
MRLKAVHVVGYVFPVKGFFISIGLCQQSQKTYRSTRTHSILYTKCDLSIYMTLLNITPHSHHLSELNLTTVQNVYST